MQECFYTCSKYEDRAWTKCQCMKWDTVRHHFKQTLGGHITDDNTWAKARSYARKSVCVCVRMTRAA